MVAAGDLESTRLVYAMVIGLAAIGVLFVLLGIWVIRQTRVDLEMLAPLERMGDRDWRKSDPASQRRSLDEIRPEGAEPIQPEPHRPRVDAEFGQSDRPVESFDDLAPIGPEGDDPTPTGTEASTDSGDVELVGAESEPADAADDGSADAEIESESADAAVDSADDAEIDSESADVAVDSADVETESADRAVESESASAQSAVEPESAVESAGELNDVDAGDDGPNDVSNEGTTERVEQ